eukprot:scaffold6103_cov44-Prasinocladus_malaysianus.AAC.2
MANTLAALHSQDPEALGLRDYGRPSNYCARQVTYPGRKHICLASIAAFAMLCFRVKSSSDVVRATKLCLKYACVSCAISLPSSFRCSPQSWLQFINASGKGCQLSSFQIGFDLGKA